MKRITQFEEDLAKELPETHALLAGANLVVHDSVEMVTLHGSRGPQGGARPDSDVDLCLTVERRAIDESPDAEALLREVLRMTAENWRGPVEADLAAAFDKSNCGLRCLDTREFDPELCPSTVDCMGVFKVQRGFDGFVTGPVNDCSKMYPLMVIWRRP